MNRYAKLLLIVGLGLLAHLTDRPLLAVEHDTDQVSGKQTSGLWYLFIRYGIGVLACLVGQEFLRRGEEEREGSRNFEDGLLSAGCVGCGVFIGHLLDDLWG